MIKLCDRWPIDTLKDKSNRDLGLKIRETVVASFPMKEETKLSEEEKHRWDQTIHALNELISDRHRNDFPVSAYKTGTMGYDLEGSRHATSDAAYAEIERASRSYLHKWLLRFSLVKRRLFGNTK